MPGPRIPKQDSHRARGSFELAENLQVIFLGSSSTRCSYNSRETEVTHPRIHTASFTHTHTRFYISQGSTWIQSASFTTRSAHLQLRPIQTPKTFLLQQNSSNTPLPQNIDSHLQNPFSGGPRLKANLQPHKCSVKLAALLPSALSEHRLLVTQDMS